MRMMAGRRPLADDPIVRHTRPFLQHQAVEDRAILFGHLRRRVVGHEVELERSDRGLDVPDVVAERLQQCLGVGARRNGRIGRVAPQAEAASGERSPGEVATRVDFAARGDVSVSDHVFSGDADSAL